MGCPHAAAEATEAAAPEATQAASAAARRIAGTPTHGHEATREATMAAFAKSWRDSAERAARPDVCAAAQTTFGNFQSVQSSSTSPLPLSNALNIGAPANSIAQAGGVVSLSNQIILGQSFSVVSGSGFGPLTVANSSMGAGYGGRVVAGILPPSLTYQESVTFTQIGGAFVLDFISTDALGIGFA